MKNIDIKLLEKYGLLAEFAYITLESDYYKFIGKDDIIESGKVI